MPEKDDMDELNFGDDEPGGDEEGGQAAATGGGGLKRFLSGTILKVLMYVAAAIVVFIIALIAGRMGGGSSSKEGAYQADKQALEEKKPPLTSFELKEFMVNTADVDSSHFLRLKLNLAYKQNNLPLQTELGERKKQIYDVILRSLNEKKKEDIDTAQGKQDLKEELMKKINGILEHGEILDVYYEEFSVN